MPYTIVSQALLSFKSLIEGILLVHPVSDRGASARYVGTGLELRNHLARSGITSDALFEPLLVVNEEENSLQYKARFCLATFHRFVTTVYNVRTDPAQVAFCVEDQTQGSTKDRTIAYWCLHSGQIFKEVVHQGLFHSVLVTSGTLAPLEAVRDELGLDFPVDLLNSHVAPLRNLLLGVLPWDPQGHQLTSLYSQRSMLPDRLGDTILQLVQCIPHGVIVFFTSFEARDHAWTAWSQHMGTTPSIRIQLSQVRVATRRPLRLQSILLPPHLLTHILF